MPRVRLAILALVVASFAVAVPAQAGFAPDNEFIAGGEFLSTDDIAIDAQGNSIVVWSHPSSSSASEKVQARRLNAAGELGPIIEVAPPGEIGRHAAVALTDTGRAFVAWRYQQESGDPIGVKGRWVEPDGALGPVLTIIAGEEGKAEIESLLVTVDPAGIVTVGWRNHSEGGGLAIRRVQPGGTLSAIAANISDGHVDAAKIAALPDGSTLAVWRGALIEKTVVSSALVAETPETISSSGLVANPGLAVDSRGNGLVAWGVHETVPTPEEFSIRGRLLDPDGAPNGEELMIDEPDPGFGLTANVTADSSDNFLVNWGRQNAEGDQIAYARPVDSSGGFPGPAQPISSATESGGSQQAALLDAGVGAMLWRNDSGDSIVGRAFDSLAMPTGGIQELLDAAGIIRVASAPAAGAAAFLIEYWTGSSREAVVRRFLVPPVCGAVSGTVVQGNPTTLPVACTGAGIEAAQVIQTPAHGTVVPGLAPGGPVLTYTPRVGFEGNDTFTYIGVSDGGASAPAQVTVAVGKETVEPTVTSLRFVKTAGKAGKKRSKRQRSRADTSARKKKSLPAYKFKLRFDELATAVVKVERKLPGVRKGKRCVKPKPGRRDKPGKRCPRWRSIGTVASDGFAVETTIEAPRTLRKRLSKGGRFRIEGVATDRAGNDSNPKRVFARIAGKAQRKAQRKAGKRKAGKRRNAANRGNASTLR